MVSRSLNGHPPQNRTYNPPTPNGQNNTYAYRYQYNQPQTNGQPNPVRPPQNGGYTYAPPTRNPYTPPKPAPNGHRQVKPVPPPAKPDMIQKRKPSNAKFWFVGVMCALYALNMPMYRWIDLAALAAVGVGAFFLGRLIFKGKKY